MNRLVFKVEKRDRLMTRDISLTQMICAAFILTKDKRGKYVPVDRTAWAYALKEAKQKGLVPEPYNSQLHFVNGATEIVCLEVEKIQRTAVQFRLMGNPSPEYTQLDVRCGKQTARCVLSRLKLDEPILIALGNSLRDSMREYAQQQA